MSGSFDLIFPAASRAHLNNRSRVTLRNQIGLSTRSTTSAVLDQPLECC